MRFRKSELERLTEKRERAEASAEEARERVGTWPKVQLRRAPTGFLTRFEGEEKPTGGWRSQFKWYWKQAGTEEDQQEVFKHYLNKLTYSPDLGYNKETAGKALMSEIARVNREEEK